MRLYHPKLERTWDGPDDDRLFAVMAEAGWSKTVPADHNPAHAADQPNVVYKPHTPDESKKGRKAN